jgi:hypothetical protein
MSYLGCFNMVEMSYFSWNSTFHRFDPSMGLEVVAPHDSDPDPEYAFIHQLNK